MTGEFLTLLAAVAPATPAQPPILDHHIKCQLLEPQGTVRSVNATTTAHGNALPTIDVRGDVGGVPLPDAGATAITALGTIGVISTRGDAKYMWLFTLPVPSIIENGYVKVIEHRGTGSMAYVATGTCSDTPSRASDQ